MNRKTFLSTICALFTAPFVKSKEKEKVLVKNQTDRKYNGIYEPEEPLTRKEISLSEFRTKYQKD